MRNHLLSLIERIRLKRETRKDADDWITINGTHVLLGENGEAVSGGKLKGMRFANARSNRGGKERSGSKPTQDLETSQNKLSAKALGFIPEGTRVRINGEWWKANGKSGGFISENTNKTISAQELGEKLGGGHGDIAISVFGDKKPSYEDAVSEIQRIYGQVPSSHSKETVERWIQETEATIASLSSKEGDLSPEEKENLNYWTKKLPEYQAELDQIEDYESACGAYMDAIRTEYESSGRSLLKPDSMMGFQRGDEMTEEEADNKSTNPKRTRSGANLDYLQNCQTCVVAYEARLRGFNVSAGKFEGTRDNPLLKLSLNSDKAWIDPQTGRTPTPVSYHGEADAYSTYDWLKENMKEGERYNLSFGWSGITGEGHIICCKRVKDKIELFDPQIGTHVSGHYGVMDYLRKTDSQLRLLRVDNLMFNTETLNGCFENGPRRASKTTHAPQEKELEEWMPRF